MSLVGVDWGTTSLRAYLVDATGAIAESVEEAGAGTLALSSGGPDAFAAALDKLLAKGGAAAWRDRETPVLLCGMVGSRQGWKEVPHVPAPATAAQVSAAIQPLRLADGREAFLVPGLSSRPRCGTAPDVMRGEETQLFGAAASGSGTGLFVLPGTHSKWASCSSTEGVVSFETQMTGEVFEVLKGHSILGKLMEPGSADHWEAFDAGVARSGTNGGLLSHIFACRTEGLAGSFPPEALPSFLSGVLIGHELRGACNGLARPDAVTLVGSGALCERYRRAFGSVLGIAAKIVPGHEAVVHGLRELWKSLNAKRDAVKLKARFENAMAACPLVAILRGVKPTEVVAVGDALVAAGFRIIEVPMNSPDAVTSIGLLAKAVPDDVVVGAGTVLTTQEVDRVADVGGALIVSPNVDTAVVRHSKTRGLICLPGVATPTEAFAAFHAGADGLKAFPGEQIPPKIVKAWSAVLPKGYPLLVVGGVTPEGMAEYWAAGARGYGIGSNVYKPGAAPEDVGAKAAAFVSSVKELCRADCAARSPSRPKVLFVLGGPGSGKGTQCTKVTEAFESWAHISAGDCLRDARNDPTSRDGDLINSFIKDGKIVPTSITVKLLREAMAAKQKGGKTCFLIDGFPRNLENLVGWQENVGDAAAVCGVLFFDASEAELEKRLLARGETSGRNDDNIVSIRKRFGTYQTETMPIIDKYRQEDKVFAIDAMPPIEQVSEETKAVLSRVEAVP